MRQLLTSVVDNPDDFVLHIRQLIALVLKLASWLPWFRARLQDEA